MYLQKDDKNEINKFQISLRKQLGGEGQTKVYECEINGLEDRYVSRTVHVFNDTNTSKLTFKRSYQEFITAGDLIHHNLIDYKYFMV